MFHLSLSFVFPPQFEQSKFDSIKRWGSVGHGVSHAFDLSTCESEADRSL